MLAEILHREETAMQRILSRALYEEITVEDRTFVDEHAEGLEGRTLECAGCTFERCTFADFRIDRYDFAGCTFRGCDLSGLTMSNSRLSRAALIDCRLSGLTITDGLLRDVSFTNCRMDYAALSASKFTRVDMTGCSLRHGILGDVKAAGWSISRCDLTEAEHVRTPLNGLDLSDSALNGLLIDPADLRGATVNALQALAFARLMGLHIKD